MNRYLLAAILGSMAFLTLLGLGNGGEALRRAGSASRSTISANPSAAAEGTSLTGIESAGQNVMRQTSPEAIEILGNSSIVQTPNNTPQTSTATPPQDPNATPPVPPSATPPPQQIPPATTPPATDQEAIPALW